MASQNFGKVTLITAHASDEIYIRDVAVTTLITQASQFAIASQPGIGASVIASGAALAIGTGTSIPVALRRIREGANITIDETATEIIINGISSGVLTLTDGPNPGTSLIYDPLGVMKTVSVTNSITLNTATLGRLIIGLALTNAGGGVSLLNNTGGQIKTLAASGAITLNDAGGLITHGLNLTTLGGATSPLSSADGVFKTFAADAGITLSTATANQLRFGLNLTEQGSGSGFLSSPNGVFRRLNSLGGLILSNPDADTVGIALQLTNAVGVGESLISSSLGVLRRLTVDGALIISTVSDDVVVGMALASIGTGTELYADDSGIFRRLAAGTGVGLSIVSDAIQISATGVQAIGNASVSGVPLVSTTAGLIKTIIAGAGMQILDSPAGSVTFNNIGVLSIQSIGGGQSLINAASGTVKSVVGGTGFVVTSSSTEMTVSGPAVGASGNFMVSNGSAWGSSTIPSNGTPGGLLGPAGSNTDHYMKWNTGTSRWDVALLQVGTRLLPTAGTSGNLLVSNGSIWVSSALPIDGTVGGLMGPNGSNTDHYLKWNTGTSKWEAALLQAGVRLLPNCTVNQQLIASGTNTWAAVTVAGGTLPAPGSSGNVLASNGTSWVSQAITGATNKVTVSGTNITLPNSVQIGSSNGNASTGTDTSLLVVGPAVLSGSTNKTSSLVVGTGNNTVSGAIANVLFAGDGNTISTQLSAGVVMGSNIVISGNQSLSNIQAIGSDITVNQTGSAVIGGLRLIGTGIYATSLPTQPRNITILEGGPVDTLSSFYDASVPGRAYISAAGNLAGVNLLSGDAGDIRIGGSTTSHTRFVDRCPRTAIAPTIDDHLANKYYVDQLHAIHSGYYFKANKGTTPQSIAQTEVSITFPNVIYNNNSVVIVSGTNNTTFVVNNTGYYRVDFSAVATLVGATTRTLRGYIDRAQVEHVGKGSIRYSSGKSGQLIMYSEGLLTSGDSIRIRCIVLGGGSYDIGDNEDDYSCVITIRRFA